MEINIVLMIIYLKKEGLCETLLQQGEKIRFLMGAEALILMMPCYDTFLPRDQKTRMKIGTSITTGHAALV